MSTATKEKLEVQIMQHGRMTKEIDIPDSISVLGDGQEKGGEQGLFRIINQKDGDKRLAWNKMHLTEINEAKEMFDQLVEEGLVPYRVDSDGQKTGTVMQEFDPSAEEIIFAPIAMVVGG